MHILITGGAGFIGANLTANLLQDGYRVTIYDNLSRPGVGHNLTWLRTRFGDNRVQLRKQH
jgi:CDP-paratose 2-epimerase